MDDKEREIVLVEYDEDWELNEQISRAIEQAEADPNTLIVEEVEEDEQ